jgi:hypothetical protein
MADLAEITQADSLEIEKDGASGFYAAVSAIARFIEAADKDAPDGAAPSVKVLLAPEPPNGGEILTELESEIHHKSESYLV